ncbi:MAG: hypothetical protein R3E66_20580 [bacterium]
MTPFRLTEFDQAFAPQRLRRSKRVISPAFAVDTDVNYEKDTPYFPRV